MIITPQVNINKPYHYTQQKPKTFKGTVSNNTLPDRPIVKLNPENLKANFISFGRLEDVRSYDLVYGGYDNSNGKLPEPFVLDFIKYHFPSLDKAVKSKVNILDIGAGDGRNTVPLVKRGYSLTAIEPSSKGTNRINSKLTKPCYQNLLSLLNIDILEHNQTKTINKKHDIAYMVHLSQHFTIDDMKDALKNTAELLKPGGHILFDALIRLPGYYDKHIDDYPIAHGWSNYDQTEIEQLAKDLDLEVIIIKDYKFQKEDMIAAYKRKINQLWGRNKTHPNNLDVQLKWFVLKKKDLN